MNHTFQLVNGIEDIITEKKNKVLLLYHGLFLDAENLQNLHYNTEECHFATGQFLHSKAVKISEYENDF